MCKRFSRAAEKLNAEARLLLRRANGQEVEFVTIMWFEDLDAVRRFVGEDYARSHVPPEARAVLAPSTSAPPTTTCWTAARSACSGGQGAGISGCVAAARDEYGGEALENLRPVALRLLR